MLKKAVVIAMFAVTPAAFSASIFNLAVKNNKHHPIAAEAPSVKGHEPKYKDFSGTWIGTCSSEDQEITAQETWIIENSAFSITVNGDETNIGSFQSKSDVMSNFAYYEHYRLDWSATGDSLLFNGVTMEQSSTPTIMPTVEEASATLSIENGLLIFNGTVNKRFNFTCSMKKN